VLFGKGKTEIYKSHRKEEFRKLRTALKEAGIRMSSGSVETECTSGCGAKISMHKAINKDFDPYLYYIYVSEEEAEKAFGIMKEMNISSDLDDKGFRGVNSV
jgi:hypothetical protein